MTEMAVLICGHGSRDPEAIAEFELVADALRPRLWLNGSAAGLGISPCQMSNQIVFLLPPWLN